MVQVVDCRRILKWTYAYGYYRFGEQALGRNGLAVPAETLKQQQEFFEFNQVGQHPDYFVMKQQKPLSSLVLSDCMHDMVSMTWSAF